MGYVVVRLFVFVVPGRHIDRSNVGSPPVSGAILARAYTTDDVVIILAQGRWSHRPPLMYPETEQSTVRDGKQLC